jgi:hypothetical protein
MESKPPKYFKYLQKLCFSNNYSRGDKKNCGKCMKEWERHIKECESFRWYLWTSVLLLCIVTRLWFLDFLLQIKWISFEKRVSCQSWGTEDGFSKGTYLSLYPTIASIIHSCKSCSFSLFFWKIHLLCFT